MFGAAKPGGFSFGAPAAAAPGGGSLFGAPAGAAPNANLFGTPVGSSAPGTTPLFGSPAGSKPAAPSLFGATPANAAAPTPSLFGAPTASSAAPAPSLFGAPAAASAAPTSNLFGAPAATTSAPGGTSLFGAPNPAAGGGLFGAAKPAATATPGQPAFGAAVQPRPQTPAGPVTLKTKYSEIPEDIRKQVDEVENFIQQQIRTAESVAVNTTSDLVNEITAEVKQLSQKVAGLNNMLERDKFAIERLRQQVGRELRSSDLVSRFIERYRSGSHHSTAPPKHDAYMSYFLDFADTLEQRMQQYRHTIQELEMSIKALSQEKTYSPAVLVEIMRDQDDSLLAVASKIAAVHDAISRQKALYLEYRQKYFGVNDAGRFEKINGTQNDADTTPLELIASTTLRPSNMQSQLGQSQPFQQHQPQTQAFGQQQQQQQQLQQPNAFGTPALGAAPAFGSSRRRAPTGLSLFTK
ncbi:uncharacterized protein EV422DRAFT_322479 [Fimicolochytrium jonesii]|uniref:uncharacterized protein n=1 Tax=Fimicolochytrium jonesii TaxID=1396493 RepID=UPI0022FEA907|nr:uncharacterized protein EV422DRAFT_322479 [Fimicolochytrium jonesii]KAI8824495.1 hypothetical protein EV422DRAFT_322479 [Fimicolochytrium jonesii]